MVEMALTLPVVLVLLLGTLDLGRAVYAQNVIANAAREGARYGIIAASDSLDSSELQELQTRVLNSSIGLSSDDISITIESPNDTHPDAVQVRVTHSFQAVTPLAGRFLGTGGQITLEAVSTMRVEGSQ